MFTSEFTSHNLGKLNLASRLIAHFKSTLTMNLVGITTI